MMKSIRCIELIVLSGALLLSCKKEIEKEPTVIVTVVDSVGLPLENASIDAIPYYEEVDHHKVYLYSKNHPQQKSSDQSGQATFHYRNSGTLDVFGEYVINVGDTMVGMASIYLEKKEVAEGEENIIELRLILRR